MRKVPAAVGSSAFFLLAPGVLTGLIPYGVTRWRVADEYPAPVRAVGVVLIVAGALVLVEAFVRFVREGAGTPAPGVPTEHLIVGGLYRYVRNPIYLALQSVIGGQVLLLGQPRLLLYALALFGSNAALVHRYEEPTLAARYGERYETYRRAVPAWLPRLRPWTPTWTQRP